MENNFLTVFPFFFFFFRSSFHADEIWISPYFDSATCSFGTSPDNSSAYPYHKINNWKPEPGEATVGTEKMTSCPSVSPAPSGLAHAAPGKCKKRGGLSNKETKALLSSILLWPTFTDSCKQQRKSTCHYQSSRYFNQKREILFQTGSDGYL